MLVVTKDVSFNGVSGELAIASDIGKSMNWFNHLSCLIFIWKRKRKETHFYIILIILISDSGLKENMLNLNHVFDHEIPSWIANSSPEILKHVCWTAPAVSSGNHMYNTLSFYYVLWKVTTLGKSRNICFLKGSQITLNLFRTRFRPAFLCTIKQTQTIKYEVAEIL